MEAQSGANRQQLGENIVNFNGTCSRVMIQLIQRFYDGFLLHYADLTVLRGFYISCDVTFDIHLKQLFYL
jgi:hypothetical protein